MESYSEIKTEETTIMTITAIEISWVSHTGAKIRSRPYVILCKTMERGITQPRLFFKGSTTIDAEAMNPTPATSTIYGVNSPNDRIISNRDANDMNAAPTTLDVLIIPPL